MSDYDLNAEITVDRLVRQRLIERTDGLENRSLAAFVDGWSSLLELVERPDLLLPDVSDESREAVLHLTRRIREAQERVLQETTR